MLKNENGYVIVVALLVLSILTVIAVTGLRTSITEQQISTNALIHHMNFYAADSGPAVASIVLKDETFLPESEYANASWLGTDTIDLPNGTQFTYEVTHQVNSDGEILRYGDPDGDHLWEINTTVGRPLEIVESHGTHIGRGGDAAVQVTLQFSPAFELPNTALWVDNPDAVDFKGNATVSGDSIDPSLCPDVPDVLHHLNPINPMDEPAHFGEEFVHESSGGMYPFGPVKESLLERADHVGSLFPTVLAEASTSDDPVVIIIEGDLQINNEDLKTPAYGILYVDGNLRINGNVEWNGLIVTTGNASVGNGTADITGCLVTGDSADVDISGTIIIQHDCTTLQSLFDNLSRYRMTSWRQL
jgi:hypothetical protein